MNEFALGVFAICLVGGVLIKLSSGYGDSSRIAIAVITIYVIAAPAVDAIKNADFDSILGEIPTSSVEYGAEYEAYTLAAFEEGIIDAVAKEFSLEKSEISVLVSGFCFDEMQADSVRVILSGRAALSDYRSIENYLNELNIGECSVEIKIG